MFLFGVFFSFFLFNNVAIAQVKKQYVVVLDAGHGGSDPGKVGYKGYQEKDLALKITKLVGQKLSLDKDIKVVYTRKTDKFIKLYQRGKIANNANADLFVSIHCNAHSPKAHGTETWVLGLHANKKNFEVAKRENSVILLEDNYEENYHGFDPSSPESVVGLTLMQEENLDKSLLLASTIQQHFKKKLKRTDRGVKQAGFVVLHQTTMPSVLVETGFITNPKEARYLKSKKGQTEIASSIAEAVEKYVEQLKMNTVTIIDEVKAPSKENKKGVVFKVQLASSKTKLATKPYNFKGLKNIERTKVNSLYKYFYDKSSSFDEIKTSLKTAKEKGYKDAFVVAFKNGERISVKEALK